MDKIKKEQDKYSVIAFEVSLQNINPKIDSLKFHPELGTHLGVLSNNMFSIYDLSENIESPEFKLDLRKK